MSAKNKIQSLLSTALRFLGGLFLKLAGMVTSKTETSVHDNARQGHVTLAEAVTGVVVAGLVMGGALQAKALVENARVTGTFSQVKSFEAAVTTFRDTYHAFPGDFAEAGTRLPGCTGLKGADCNPFPATAGDKIVGNPDFAKSWASQVTDTTHVPALSANDETVLFWTHLHRAEFISGITDDGMKNGQQVAWEKTHPLTPLRNQTGYIVGYTDGRELPSSANKNGVGIEGLAVMIVTTPVLTGKGSLIAPEQQPLSPNWAAQIDRKMDDGQPTSGYVQVYGAPRCLFSEVRETGTEYIARMWQSWPNSGVNILPEVTQYNELSDAKDCGLAFRIQG